MTATRVAFTAIGGAKWTGGRNYLINLLGAVDRFESGRVRPVLFLGEDVGAEVAAPFEGMKNVEVVRSPAFDAARAPSRLRDAVLFGVARAAISEFERARIDVVFESATFYGWRSPFPTIAWIPDFQHRRLSSHFTRWGYWRREAGFQSQVATGRTLMLSSEDARKDCELFYPNSKGRTGVVRFTSTVSPYLLEADPERTAAQYELPDHFFFLPNQFWTHKNHALVVDALSLLKQRGTMIVVAASGNPLDPRSPRHFQQLAGRVRELGLEESFRVLGMIPRTHLISLMRTCTAILNPSFFEGWSSTVEEARALGVPMILSHIGVHQEQMGDEAVYFDPTRPEALADLLVEAVAAARARPPEIRTALNNDVHVRRFASNFADLVERARAGRSKSG